MLGNCFIQTEKRSILINTLFSDADFTNMEILDGDDGLLKDQHGNVAKRDIVQFVPFSQFKNNPSMLAAETLREIPGQFVDAMKQRGIKPY